ncbi:MAG: hypothetical protein DYH17_14265 [Xanthomonadales bacterium PRO6]|nr:hypothetical protein [Xanthomonadales bacterium PRO6]
MGSRSKALSFSLLALLAAPLVQAQLPATQALRVSTALAYAHEDYGFWREQVRVASPQRRARWNAPPSGAVRVYYRRFDARWRWRSAPRHRVIYTYYRGDLWFLDPTTGWAWSVDRYGIVYTADPYRGWVYSLGPLTRWTADLLYFFDLYRFDRGYWYCSDYDYFVDLWEGPSRYGYYSYDTAYTNLWDWEPYWRSPTFISYSDRFSAVWVGEIRRHYDYIERNPHYRREMIDSVGLPAVQAAPPRQVSPRAVATSAYWEARDLAAAGLAPPPRGRDIGRGWQAGTIVDTREAPARVVEPGAPAPGFNAPFPEGSYGLGARPGEVGQTGAGLGRGRDGGGGSPPTAERPRFDPPSQPQKEPEYRMREAPRFEAPREEARTERPRFDPPSQPQKEPEYRMREAPRFEPPSEPQKEEHDERSARGALDKIGLLWPPQNPRHVG